MKKIVMMVLVCALVATTSLFALDISFGGSVGSVVTQSYSGCPVWLPYYNGTTVASSKESFPYPVLSARPNFGIAANFGFDGLGLLTGFDFSFENSKSVNSSGDVTYKYRWTYETIYLTPYFPWKGTNWTLSIGPTIGVKFYQYENENTSYTGAKPYYSQTQSFFVWGATFGAKYSINDHLSVYVDVPVLVDAGKSPITTKSNGSEVNENKYPGFGDDNIYAVPKIGIMYKL